MVSSVCTVSQVVWVGLADGSDEVSVVFISEGADMGVGYLWVCDDLVALVTLAHQQLLDSGYEGDDQSDLTNDESLDSNESNGAEDQG